MRKITIVEYVITRFVEKIKRIRGIRLEQLYILLTNIRNLLKLSNIIKNRAEKNHDLKKSKKVRFFFI